MKRILLAYLLSVFSSVFAAAPAVKLSVDKVEPLVTETWQAEIVFYLEPLTGRFAETCPLSSPSSSPFPSFFDERRTGVAIRNFPVEGTRFSHAIAREEIDGVNYWRVTLTSAPIPAERPGVIEVGPVVVEASLFDGKFQRGFFGSEAHTVNRRFTAPKVSVKVVEPPVEGRPIAYCGALGSNVTVTAALDTSICTSGDPLMLTVRVAGSTDPSRVRAPAVAEALGKSGVFKADRSSVKSRVEGNTRVFTWRVRALKAGTVEFPALPIAYFDIATRRYHELHTESLPVQVKAGEQVALALIDEEEGEAFPMPDGLDLDFPDGGNTDFTFKRAISLATRATGEAEFAAAAKAYGDYLQQLPESPMAWAAPIKTFGERAATLARHMENLGALRLLGGDARGALAAFSRSSEFAGDDPSRIRGMRAAMARLKNDPRAELPLTRVLFPFFFRLPLMVRCLAVLGALLVLGGAWWLAGRLGRGGVLMLAVAFAAAGAQAQWSFRSSFGGGERASVKASVSLWPSETVVGEPSSLIFAFEVERGVDVDELQLRGLPDPQNGAMEYGELERMPDATTSQKGFVVKRIRLPVRFNRPFKGEIAPTALGMLVTRRGNGSSFNFTSSVNFSRRCTPCKLDVQPLPQEGRPQDFSGAVGRDFNLRLQLMPEKVRPGDLVTAEYTLTFNGYFPTNVLPRVEGLTDAFKVYEPKETARTGSSVKWRQMLVPHTAAATNVISLSVGCFDTAEKRYREVKSRAAHLVFVSETAASTRNTAVVIDASGAGKGSSSASGKAGGGLVELHFAPARTSPVVAVLPPDVELKELSRRGNWRRMASDRAIGWMEQAP